MGAPELQASLTSHSGVPNRVRKMAQQDTPWDTTIGALFYFRKNAFREVPTLQKVNPSRRDSVVSVKHSGQSSRNASSSIRIVAQH